MFNVSLRDPQKQSEFGLTPYTTTQDFTKLNYRRVLIVIPGYNNDDSEMKAMGVGLESYRNGKPLEICALSWPSNGNIFNYTQDRKDAKEAGNYLATLIQDLKAKARTVSVLAHSMGNFVFANALDNLWPGDVENWYSFGADIASICCKPDGKWGKHGNKIKNAYFYYSKGDLVLGLLSKVRNVFVSRVGFEGLPREHPSNWHEIDACDVYNQRRIKHSDYFKIRQIFDEIYVKEAA